MTVLLEHTGKEYTTQLNSLHENFLTGVKKQTPKTQRANSVCIWQCMQGFLSGTRVVDAAARPARTERNMGLLFMNIKMQP